MKIWKEFFIEAAHYLLSAPSGHPNSRIHGHSFRVRVTLEGQPDPKIGLIMHLGDLRAVLEGVKEKLDHRLLNEVEGLETGTIENMTKFIWDNAKPLLPLLFEVAVTRETCMEGCIYNGPSQ
jgi:6-pyruvoyltetrahydropterin/6-carboxytetrahydropterin synthase